jgi:site-specific DNA recombinase
MKPAAKKPQRCAIYTRVSTDNGLELEFNSLHAQREAAQAYIKSQAHEGWKPIRDHYDDGGFSGGSLDRPGLQKLLAAIRERRIDIVIVYKVDRLTRSLTDFAKLVELFDAYCVAFVSVTQSFNTPHAWEGSLSTCCYPSPSSSVKSLASASATRSPPLRRKGFGSAA